MTDDRLRTEALDVTKSFLVQAPAGSGKTSLLVQRFLSLLAVVEQAPEEILAITFTRKAAAEMRDRVLSALKLGYQSEPPNNEYKRKFWELAQRVIQRDQALGWDLLDNPARLKIQTIDALCSSIAGQMPIIAQFGAVPQVTEHAHDLYTKAVDFLLESSQNESIKSQVNIILTHLDNDVHKVKNLLLGMLEMRDQWLPILFDTQQQDLRTTLEASLQLEEQAVIANAVDCLPEFLDFALLPEVDIETVDGWKQIANLLLTATGEYRRTVTVAQGFAAPSSVKDKQEQLLLKERKARMLEILQQLQDFQSFKTCLLAITKLPPVTYSDEQWQVIQALYTVLPLLTAHLTLVFKDLGQVDFTAISLAALNALRSPDASTDLALALDCKIQHILVDEFQDTSLMQFALLERLTANWDPYSGKTLFLVGDPMQSIYRFRKAEVGLFLQAKQNGISNIQLNFLQLQMNFRSSPQVVQWLNQVFAATFPDLDDINLGAIKYMPAVAATTADLDVTQDATVKCINVDTADEAAEILQIIRATRQQDHNKTIAILVRAKSHVAKLLPMLRTQNIAYQAPGIELLDQRPLVQDLLALTTALLHFEDRIAWLAILRAPWCGLILTDLAIIAEPQQTIWHNLQQAEVQMQLSTDARTRVTRFITVMQDILARCGRDDIDCLVQDLWDKLGGKSCLNSAGQHIEAEAFFEFLAQYANKREIYTPGFLKQQLSFLFMPITEVDPNAVQVMTIHKAKGLEFDVVILPSLAQRTKHDDHRLLLIEQRHYPEQSLLVAPIKSAEEEHDPIYKYLAWSEHQRATHEALRLLYVAATRAKLQIYCLASLSDKEPIASSLLGQIWPVIGAEFVNSIVEKIEVNAAERTIARLPSKWYIDHRYEKLELKTNELSTNPWQQDWQRLVGIVVHRSLWHLAQQGTVGWDRERVSKQRQIWAQQLTQLGLDVAYAAQALDLIELAINNTLQDKVGMTILSNRHREAYSEWPLTIVKNGEAKQIILDRAYLDQSGVFWIIDYKTIINEQELANAKDQYAQQLQQYRKAISILRPGVQVNAGLYLPLQSKYIGYQTINYQCTV